VAVQYGAQLKRAFNKHGWAPVIHVCIYIYMNLYIYIKIYKHVYIFICSHIDFTYMYRYIYICVYVFIYMHLEEERGSAGPARVVSDRAVQRSAQARLQQTRSSVRESVCVREREP
jgi:hypothetical protein